MPKNAGGRGDHQAAHATLLKRALERPGVQDVMTVYQGWRWADQGLDPYRAATTDPAVTKTTDHANVG